MSVALAQTRDVAFVIAWSCPMENSIEQSAYLVRNYVLCDGGSEEEARAAEHAYVQRACARTYAEYRAAAEVLEGIPAIHDGLGWAGVEPEEEFTPPDSTSESFLDPSTTVASLEIPIIALFAENDRQVDPIQGAEAYRRLLVDGGHALSTVTIIRGADHNMNLSPRGCMQDQKDGYRSVGGKTLSPVFQEAVAEWLGRLKTHVEQDTRQ
jgi:pimeloyl-ACP methyl ester carboxylesterase